MVKSCCAVGCTNCSSKGSSIHFYRFPANPQRRLLCIAGINRSVFDYVNSPVKRKRQRALDAYI